MRNVEKTKTLLTFYADATKQFYKKCNMSIRFRSKLCICNFKNIINSLNKKNNNKNINKKKTKNKVNNCCVQ